LAALNHKLSQGFFIAYVPERGTTPATPAGAALRYASIAALAPSLGGRIHAVVPLKVVEADADLSHMARRVRGGAKADDRIHLADHAFGATRRPETDLAVPGARFELVELEQGVAVHVDVDAQAPRSIRSQRHGGVAKRLAKRRRAFDRIVTERHGLLRSFRDLAGGDLAASGSRFLAFRKNVANAVWIPR
jgi:hypothetical protein